MIFWGTRDRLVLCGLAAIDSLSLDNEHDSPNEVKAAIDATEFAAKTDAQKQQVIELVKRDDLDLFGLDKDILVDIFGASKTGTSMLAARVESISRATELRLPVMTAKYLRMHTLNRKAQA